jgi:hypothetical protein
MTTKLTDLTLSAKSMRASCCCASNATILDFWYSNNNGVQGIFHAETTSFITEFMYQVGQRDNYNITREQSQHFVVDVL